MKAKYLLTIYTKNITIEDYCMDLVDLNCAINGYYLLYNDITGFSYETT